MQHSVNQAWFEMVDIRRRRLDNAVWVPLRSAQSTKRGETGFLGYSEEFIGAGSVAVPLDKRSIAEGPCWDDLGLFKTHRGFVENGRYIPCEAFEAYEMALCGVNLALAQDGTAADPPEWHLLQDFVITLRLKREGDSWLAMDEGYCEVARLKRDENRPILLEVRSEHLKDYLCARGMALYVSTYRLREEVVEDAMHIQWDQRASNAGEKGDRWEGQTAEIHEGGGPFGSSAAMLHLERTDVDFAEDVPHIRETDENLTSTLHEARLTGRKLTRITGELRRNEWVEPADRSVRIRGDKPATSIFFFVDAQGTRMADRELSATDGWLWFRPEVISALIDRRGGSLKWYTRETGGVTSSPSSSHRHFGVNSLGFVNVLAEDISNLPQWTQLIWSGFNISPEGGVSKELLAVQSEGVPAGTRAPEDALPQFIEMLNGTSKQKVGFDLFRIHEEFASLIARTHRFKSTNQANFFALAKDLSRLTADSINIAELKKVVTPPKGETWGSLKLLENLLAGHIDPARAHAILGPLFGIYDLRLADAHLPSGDLDDALKLVRVDSGAPFVIQGFQLIHACVSTLASIGKAIDSFPDRTV